MADKDKLDAEMRVMAKRVIEELIAEVGREQYLACPAFYEDVATRRLAAAIPSEQMDRAACLGIQGLVERWIEEHGAEPTAEDIKAQLRAHMDAEGKA